MSEHGEDFAIGQRIAAARQKMGWTQTDLALVMRRRGVKWSPAIVGLVENGRRPVRLTEARWVAAVLLKDLEWIAGGKLSALDLPEPEVTQ